MLRRAIPLLYAASALLWMSSGAGAPPQFEDPFEAAAQEPGETPAWVADSPAWALSGGKYGYAGGPGSFSIFARAKPSRQVAAEVTVWIKEQTSADWKVAGLAIFQDPQNFWHVALVEQPESMGRGHFVQLAEMYHGRWHAQAEQATRLTPKFGSSAQLDWKYNHPYRLRIQMSGDAVTAQVSELNGPALARLGFRLDNPAVRYGKPALHCGGFDAAFDDFAAATGEPVAALKPQYPAFNVPASRHIRGKATGFYHVELRGGTWWVIDPKGRAFFIIGTDHANYNVHWCESLGYAPYHRSCQAKYGSEQSWAESTIQRLKEWGFNSLGANHSPSLRYKGLAHTEFLALGQKFASYDNIVQQVHWTGFPNVFSPRFREFCEQQAALQCAPHRDDPWLLGYFLDNELEWYGKSHSEYGLFDEAFKKPADHTAKQALVDFLRARYRTAEEMSRAWAMPVASFESLLQSTEPPAAVTPEAKRDKLDFVRRAAELYFSITAAAIRKADPNHMILGCRFAGRAPNIWDIAGRYCDIVSVNCYRRVDLDEGVEVPFLIDLNEWHAAAQRPLMITEWSFPALDSGLPCTHGAGQRFDTQEQRAKAFSAFQHFLFTRPFIVGSDFFMWVDEPTQGIASTFPENSNYGLVNGEDEPYALLTQAAARLHRQVYDLHSGATAELSAKVAANGRDVIVTNAGKARAAFIVQQWLDGERSQVHRTLAPGARYTHRDGSEPGPGCHALTVILDPEGEVSETVREDNQARALSYNPGAPWPAWARDYRERVPLAVTSGRAPVSGAVVTIPLSSLPWQSGVRISDASGQEVPFQIDILADGVELAFPAGDLEAFDCRTFFLYPQAVPLRGTVQNVRTFEIDNGCLKLSKHSDNGDLVDEVTANRTPLGRLLALFEIGDGESEWRAPERVDSATVSEGPVRAVADVTASITGTLQTRYRLVIYPGQQWFSAKMLWVKNTSSQPLNVRRYYHYPLPAIGGSSEGDIVGPPPVPNYYRKVGLWFDPAHRACYGALTGKDEFNQTFWIDEHGNYHPDFFRDLNALLAPGEKYDAPQPWAWIFGGQCDDARGHTLALWRDMRARSEVAWRIFPAERNPHKP